MRRIITASTMAIGFALLVFLVLPAHAAKPASSTIWLNGVEVHTIAPPAHVAAGSGTDTLYVIPNQSAVAVAGPGSPNYHGGRWAVFAVAWNPGSTPVPLTSAEMVQNELAAGHITITRQPEQDNRCPLQPGKPATE